MLGGTMPIAEPRRRLLTVCAYNARPPPLPSVTPTLKGPSPGPNVLRSHRVGAHPYCHDMVPPQWRVAQGHPGVPQLLQ
eukprot:366227-Chlamydomonas_euryale.AAC.23